MVRSIFLAACKVSIIAGLSNGHVMQYRRALCHMHVSSLFTPGGTTKKKRQRNNNNNNQRTDFAADGT